MVKVKPLDVARKHFEEALRIIPDRYEDGVKLADWKTAAIQGEEAYKAAMEIVIREERRKKGIEKTTNEYWQNACIKKGKTVIRERIEAALDKWEEHWKPYRDALEALKLPPRTIDWEENIDKRLKPIVKTLVETKLKLKYGVTAS